jgi:hypothetical protein
MNSNVSAAAIPVPGQTRQSSAARLERDYRQQNFYFWVSTFSMSYKEDHNQA